MKVALISDLHGHLPHIAPDTDFILIAGDIAPDETYSGKQSQQAAITYQESWINGPFRNWKNAHGKPIYGTWGNHDFYGQAIRNYNHDGIHILTDMAMTIEGLKVFFSPWSLRIGGWAFMDTEEGLFTYFKQIPEDTQVLVVHGPPKGLGDLVLSPHKAWSFSENVGSQSLLSKIQELKDIKMVVCGHIHEGRGLYANQLINCPVLNVAILDRFYKPYPDPVIYIDWPMDRIDRLSTGDITATSAVRPDHDDGYGHGV